MDNSETVDDQLLQQGTKLIDLSQEMLLEVLGFQLLAMEQPGNSVGISLYLSNTARSGQVVQDVNIDPSEALLPISISGIAAILKQRRERAQAYIKSIEPKLHEVLCSDGKLKKELQEKLNTGTELLRILVGALGAAIGLPPVLNSISVTLAAWLCKIGLEQFCTSK